MIRASKFVAALLLAIGSFSFVGAAKAQTGPSGPIAPVVGPTTQPVAPATIGISEADLATFLRNIDQNVKIRQLNNGVEYSFSIVRDGWQYQLRVTSYAKDIWIEAVLGGRNSNYQKAPADVLNQLLTSNYEVGPSHFSLSKEKDGTVQLYLGRNLERALLNADQLRIMIDFVCKQTKDKYPAWSAYLNAVK